MLDGRRADHRDRFQGGILGLDLRLQERVVPCQEIQALQVGEDFSGVGQEARENIVDVAFVATSKDVWKTISNP